ncbi:hypothetical protein XSR1_210050 [Xenorhabdus szentirmaii DSM 16338]|uniref:Uncharacterized protein n=1 Tax=Xenorhabdus szentirmaii DSM 16338 TaxID=1427518 RepID=W1IZH9_9GAMM|nr:hypothetical protein XSR1_210050 [Xenorhabdus szentirmaii DSM 16338]
MPCYKSRLQFEQKKTTIIDCVDRYMNSHINYNLRQWLVFYDSNSLFISSILDIAAGIDNKRIN